MRRQRGDRAELVARAKSAGRGGNQKKRSAAICPHVHSIPCRSVLHAQPRGPVYVYVADIDPCEARREPSLRRLPRVSRGAPRKHRVRARRAAAEEKARVAHWRAHAKVPLAARRRLRHIGEVAAAVGRKDGGRGAAVRACAEPRERSIRLGHGVQRKIEQQDREERLGGHRDAQWDRRESTIADCRPRSRRYECCKLYKLVPL